MSPWLRVYDHYHTLLFNARLETTPLGKSLRWTYYVQGYRKVFIMIRFSIACLTEEEKIGGLGNIYVVTHWLSSVFLPQVCCKCCGRFSLPGTKILWWYDRLLQFKDTFLTKGSRISRFSFLCSKIWFTYHLLLTNWTYRETMAVMLGLRRVTLAKTVVRNGRLLTRTFTSSYPKPYIVPEGPSGTNR